MGWVRRAFCGIGLIPLVLLTGGWAAPNSGVPTATEINSVMNELSAITGFKVRRQLPFSMVTRDQINQYIKSQIKKSVRPAEIRAEETTLKKLGFVPPDFDLKQTTIELLTEQAAAFYDYRQKKLFISDWATANMRDAALIHELAHALADQNFSIQKYNAKAAESNEMSMAREAVVEGQASWLMLEVDARRGGKSLKDPDVAKERLDTNMNSDDAGYPVFNKAPLYLRKTMIFPYEDGQKFQHAVFLRDGPTAFAGVFQNAPVSTAQIIHPDRYFAKKTPANPELPKPEKDSRAFVTGTLGELEVGILLEQYLGTDEARDLSPKLGGANYRVDETKRSHNMTLVCAIEWSEDAAAERFFNDYQKVLRTKWKRVETTAETGDRFEGKSEDGFFKVVRDGKRVLTKEGFASPPV
jgi:hypothetical protein